MRKLFFLGILCLFFLNLYGVGFFEVLNSATAVNLNYKVSQLLLEKVDLDYQKEVIEAENKKAVLQAEISKLNSTVTQRKYLSDFYTEILDDFFSILSGTVSVESAGINLEIGKTDLENQKILFQKKLSSQDNLTQASLTADDYMISFRKATEELESQKRAYLFHSGNKPEMFTFHIPSYEGLFVNQDEWLKKNTSYQTALLNVEIAQYDVNNLALNVSQYDMRVAEINHEQKKTDLTISKINAINQKITSEQNIATLFEQVEIAKKRNELKENEFNDYEARYKKGFISETQYLLQKVSFLSTQKQYIDAANNYWSALISYVFSLSLIPEEVLK